MALKEKYTVSVGGVDVINYDASTSFTTDIIRFDDFNGFTLTVFYNIISGNPNGKISIECSNITDDNSFVIWNDYEDLDIPNFFEKSETKPKYIRFVYNSNATQSGNFITIEMMKLYVD